MMHCILVEKILENVIHTSDLLSFRKEVRYMLTAYFFDKVFKDKQKDPKFIYIVINAEISPERDEGLWKVVLRNSNHTSCEDISPFAAHMVKSDKWDSADFCSKHFLKSHGGGNKAFWNSTLPDVQEKTHAKRRWTFHTNMSVSLDFYWNNHKRLVCTKQYYCSVTWTLSFVFKE